MQSKNKYDKIFLDVLSYLYLKIYNIFYVFYTKDKKGIFIMEKLNKTQKNSEKAITLIALVITIIVNRVFYDKKRKYSNLVGSPMIYINL